MSAGIISHLGWILAFALALFTSFLVLRIRKLGEQREALLQEKDIVFAFMQDIGEVFTETDEVSQNMLLQQVLTYAVRSSRADAGALYLLDDDQTLLRVDALHGLFPPLQKIDKRADQTLNKPRHIEDYVRTQTVKIGEGLIGEVAASGRAVLIEEGKNDPRVPQHELDFLRIKSTVAVPMRFQHQILGVIVVINKEGRRGFEKTDLNLLQALADQASASVHYAGLRGVIDDKVKIDRDLDLARQIQNTLLPKSIPAIDGFELAAFNDPALAIGGDYYDFVQVDDQHIGIAIADVSGKGIGGAIMMSVCRSTLKAQAPGKRSPAEVLTTLNRSMTEDISEDMFVSMLYMVLNWETRELTLARAGHERPILRPGKGGGFQVIDSPGIAIGIADTGSFENVIQDVKIQLAPGDAIVAYTDGVTEAMNLEGNEWGVENFLDALGVAAEEGVESIMDNVSRRLGRFVGNQPQYDDMTLLALRVLE